ncbi:MAG: MOP flippase family protein [Candidatus Geothermincolia bacterium]
MSLRKKTITGVSWTIVSQISRLVITITVTAILARLLDPKDFGLIAMVAVFTGFFTVVNELGLSSAIIQKRDVTEEDLSSAFWVNLFEGLGITLVLALLAPLIAGFYARSVLKPIVMVLSMIFVISSAGMIQAGLFSKRMNFKTLAICEITASVLGGVTAVTMAVAGFGVWSIVSQVLVQVSVLATLLFVLSSWKPKLILKWKPIRGLLGYGLPLLGFNFVNYFSRNLDNLLIGKYLGASQLGYYDVAYKSLLFPMQNVSQVIGRVMFPALSHLEDDKARVRSAYIKATRYIAILTFPLMAGVAVLAPQLVRVLLGPKWARAIFLIEVLAAIGGLQSIYTTIGWIYLSQGRTGILFLFGVASATIYAGAFIVGLHWNVEGVAVAYAIAFVLVLYPSLAIPFRFIDMKFWHYARQFLTIAVATLCMLAVVLGLRLLLEKVVHAGDLPILVAGIIVGAACYIGILTLIDRELLQGLLQVFRDLRSNAQPGN